MVSLTHPALVYPCKEREAWPSKVEKVSNFSLAITSRDGMIGRANFRSIWVFFSTPTSESIEFI